MQILAMRTYLARRITRRHPFTIRKVPLMAKVYVYPFDRYHALGRQALFGAPNFLTFLLYQKLWPIGGRGVFTLKHQGGEKTIVFNDRNTQFQALYSKRFAQGYEPQATALVDLLVPSDGVFYDIGSNWGWFSLSLASRPDFRGRIHAFEPFPSTFRDLTAVVNQAGLEKVIRCHNLALSDKAGTAFMNLPDHFQSGLATVDEAATAGDRIATGTIDSLEMEAPFMMKIDVEGNELKVLRGASRILVEHKPMILFENGCSPSDPGQTLAPLYFLRDLGYEFYQTAWQRTHDGRNYLVGDDERMVQEPQETLALAGFEPGDRFLLRDGNIFACHRDRAGELENIFERRELR